MKSKEEREIDEMIKFEIEAGNPFSQWSSYASYASYKAKTKNVKKQKTNKVDPSQTTLKL